jgi:hypothetical protein
MLRAVLDWGMAILLENLPQLRSSPEESAEGDVVPVKAFAVDYADFLWDVWASFLHPFLAGRNFELDTRAAEPEAGLFVDFAVAATLASAYGDGAEDRRLLTLRLACCAVAESVSLDLVPILSFPRAEAVWKREFTTIFGTGGFSSEVVFSRRLMILAKKPESWRNLGLDERCALESCLFSR